LLFDAPHPLGVKGQIRAIEPLNFKQEKYIIITINDNEIQFKKIL
jgi:hypothetical protein